MHILYNTITYFFSGLLQLLALFNPKLKLFTEGRKQVFPLLKEHIKITDKVIWVHCASLGEFEQGRPLIADCKKKYPDHKIVLTFFSPSGYEVQKKYALADLVVYLPLDTPSNAREFVKAIHPSVVVFIKYEFWPNYLAELLYQNIPTILVSGIFRENQIFFKFYGGWMRSKLNCFSHFFVQDDNSKYLLNRIGFENVTISGDTRFDRVYDILQQDNSLSFVAEFVQKAHVLVAGSTWKEDEELLVGYIQSQASAKEKIIIAPHNIKHEGIQFLKEELKEKAVFYSEMENKPLADYQVLVIDTIGLLTKIYSYAHVAYVGGGYTKSGIHNILEPATFGIPIVIGPNFVKFKEAQDLVQLNGCTVADDQKSLDKLLIKLRDDSELRLKKGKICKDYIASSLGATETISKYISGLV